MPTDAAAYDRTIAGLQDQVAVLNDANRTLERHLSDHDALSEIVRGFDGKTVVDPLAIAEFPEMLRRNVAHLFKSIQSDCEIDYVRSLADPFHPWVNGVRVPTLMPRETVPYCDFSDTAINTTSFIFFANMEI